MNIDLLNTLENGLHLNFENVNSTYLEKLSRIALPAILGCFIFSVSWETIKMYDLALI